MKLNRFKLNTKCLSLSINIIPNIIHRSGPKDYNKLSDKTLLLFDYIKSRNPTYKFKYYSDKDIRKYIYKVDEELLWFYDKLIPGAYKADLFRYIVLYNEGGFWNDLTQLHTEPLDSFVKKNVDLYIPIIFNGIAIHFIGSKPKHPIFLNAINKIKKNIKTNYYGINKYDVTGPYLLGKILIDEKYPYYSNLYNKCYDGLFLEDKLIVINHSHWHRDELYSENSNNKSYSTLWHEKCIYN